MARFVIHTHNSVIDVSVISWLKGRFTMSNICEGHRINPADIIAIEEYPA